MWHRSKGKVKGKESIAYRQELPGLVSQCMLPTSVVKSALSTAVLMVDFLPSPLLVRKRNLPLLQRRNPTVMILILGLLFHTSKLALRLRKGALKRLRFILGMRLIFQEPMDPLKTPMVTLKLYTK